MNCGQSSYGNNIREGLVKNVDVIVAEIVLMQTLDYSDVPFHHF